MFKEQKKISFDDLKIGDDIFIINPIMADGCKRLSTSSYDGVCPKNVVTAKLTRISHEGYSDIIYFLFYGQEFSATKNVVFADREGAEKYCNYLRDLCLFNCHQALKSLIQRMDNLTNKLKSL